MGEDSPVGLAGTSVPASRRVQGAELKVLLTECGFCGSANGALPLVSSGDVAVGIGSIQDMQQAHLCGCAPQL